MLTRTQYERLIYTLPSRHPSICLSTLVLAPPGLDVARLTGLVAFGDDCVLCVYELLNFGQGIIEAYRYEVSRCRPPFTESPLPEAAEYCRASYPDKDKLYWYDSWPHPNDGLRASSSQACAAGHQTPSHPGPRIEFHPSEPAVPHRRNRA